MKRILPLLQDKIFSGIIVTLIMVLLSTSAVAQEPPSSDDPLFPNRSDLRALGLSAAALSELNQQLESSDLPNSPLSSVIEDFMGGEGQHPWRGPFGMGRLEIDFLFDWFDDSMTLLTEDLIQCFSPRLVSDVCPYCYPPFIRARGSWSSCPYRNNTGTVIEYWWPEATIEINNFGISNVNPIIIDGRWDLTPTTLMLQLLQLAAQLRPPLLKLIPEKEYCALQ